MRLGYVSWRPADLAERTSGVAQLRVDAWVMPSHTQAGRVADGSIDLAICWVRATDLAEQDLDGRLIGADRLSAVSLGPDESAVRAKDTAVLLDTDTATLGVVEHLCGGVRPGDRRRAGPDRRSRDHRAGVLRPRATSAPAGRLMHPSETPRRCRRTWSRRPVTDPEPCWTWALVSRRDETRAAVRAAVGADRRRRPLGLDEPRHWLPPDDPFRPH